MSLINDAIKKANQANKEKSGQSTGSGSAYATDELRVAGRPSSPPSGGMAGMFIIAGVVVFVLLGGFILALGLKNRTTARPQQSEDVQAVVAPDATRPSPRPPAEIPQNNSTGSTAESVVVHASINEVVNEANPLLAEPVPERVEAQAPPPEPAGPPEFPPLKLQGIFYRLNNPSVIINGKTLWMDESISDVKVIKIERSAVTVEFDGRTKILRLE